MIVLFKGKDERYACIAWGTLSSDPWYNRVGDKEIGKTMFYLKLSTKKSRDGENESDSISCVAWREMADICACLEKRDSVVVFGLFGRDEYNSQKKGETVFQIIVDFVLPLAMVQSFIDQMHTATETVPDEVYEKIQMDAQKGEILDNDDGGYAPGI